MVITYFQGGYSIDCYLGSYGNGVRLFIVLNKLLTTVRNKKE